MNNYHIIFYFADKVTLETNVESKLAINILIMRFRQKSKNL